MNIITQLQEVSKEDATKLVHQTLSIMAIDALNEAKKEVTQVKTVVEVTDKK